MDADAMTDEGGVTRTAKSCGPDAAVLASSFWEVSFSGATVAKEPFTGESTKYAVKPLRREGRMLSAGPVCSCAHFLVHIAHETAGAARTRSSLRPLFSGGPTTMQASGDQRREIANVC